MRPREDKRSTTIPTNRQVAPMPSTSTGCPATPLTELSDHLLDPVMQHKTYQVDAA